MNMNSQCIFRMVHSTRYFTNITFQSNEDLTLNVTYLESLGITRSPCCAARRRTSAPGPPPPSRASRVWAWPSAPPHRRRWAAAPPSPRLPSSPALWGRNWSRPAGQFCPSASCLLFRLSTCSLNILCLLSTTSLFIVILIMASSLLASVVALSFQQTIKLSSLSAIIILGDT